MKVTRKVTRKDVKRAIGWIENSNAVYNTDEKLMKIVSKAQELREVKMSPKELDKYVYFYGKLPELTKKEWEDKVYYHYNPSVEISIKDCIDDFELLEGWIEDTFQKWNDDESNSFSFADQKKYTRNYVSKSKARLIAIELIDSYQSHKNDMWNTWEEFQGYVNQSLTESNDYWDIFQNIVFA